MPVGTGFLDVRAAISPEAILARAEAGYHFTPNWSAFAFGEATKAFRGPTRLTAGVATRFTFH